MRKLVCFILVTVVTLSCNVPPGAEEPEKSSDNNSFNQSSSVFEGEWTWLGTKGEGIAGPYESDSVSAGYSWKLEFYNSDGLGGSLTYIKSYVNGEKEECSGNYSYTESNDSRKLDYACNSWLNNNRWENYLWEMKVIDEKLHLYLRNVEDCCDNTFEHHFLLTGGPNL